LDGYAACIGHVDVCHLLRTLLAMGSSRQRFEADGRREIQDGLRTHRKVPLGESQHWNAWFALKCHVLGNAISDF
jgi:hypothetical protein